MKKIIGVALLGLLAGCQMNTDDLPFDGKPASWQEDFHRDTAPMYWVHVLPSERTTTYKEIDFNNLARYLRYEMSAAPIKFQNVTLVLLDFAVLPKESPKIELTKKKYMGQTYCTKYITKPERYFVRATFYANCPPPARPLFMGSAVLSTWHSDFYEALHFMVEEIVREHVRSSLPEINLNLDAIYNVRAATDQTKYEVSPGGAPIPTPLMGGPQLSPEALPVPSLGPRPHHSEGKSSAMPTGGSQAPSGDASSGAPTGGSQAPSGDASSGPTGGSQPPSGGASSGPTGGSQPPSGGASSGPTGGSQPPSGGTPSAASKGGSPTPSGGTPSAVSKTPPGGTPSGAPKGASKPSS